MKKLFLFLLCLLVIGGCSSPTPSVELVQTSIAETQNVKNDYSVNDEEAVEIVITPTLTITLKPSATPKPTNTKIPSATPTPLPEPIILKGNGDDVVEVLKWKDAALLNIDYEGYGNFAVWNYGSDGEKFDLLVNTIGNYHGKILIDYVDGQTTQMFEVSADGSWTIEIQPLAEDYITWVNFPSLYNGEGDDVLFFDDLSGVAEFSYSGDSNFAVWGIGRYGRDLLVNEIGHYSGKVLVQKGTFVFLVHADAPWSVAITE